MAQLLRDPRAILENAIELPLSAATTIKRRIEGKENKTREKRKEAQETLKYAFGVPARDGEKGVSWRDGMNGFFLFFRGKVELTPTPAS